MVIQGYINLDTLSKMQVNIIKNALNKSTFSMLMITDSTHAIICDHFRQRSAGGTSVQSYNGLHCWLSTGQSVQILKIKFL
jgi:hypothetical protein